LFRVSEHVFKTEKVNRNITFFSLFDPVIVPIIPGLSALLLEILPIRPDDFRAQLFFELSCMAENSAQVEIARRNIKWISSAN
jgi:hypothetical protein